MASGSFAVLAAVLSLSSLLPACTDQVVEARPVSAAAPVEQPAESDPEPELPDAAAPDTKPDSSIPVSSCPGSFGSDVTPVHGRLDGIVVRVVGPGDTRCKSDDDHAIVHIDVDGALYAAWVNVESNIAVDDPAVRLAEVRAPLALGAWSPGWHAGAGTFDYAGTLGVHSGSTFKALPRDALVARLAAVVVPGARVSAYFDGFATADGGHKIHRNSGFGRDGALAMVSANGTALYLLFHFAQQVF